MKDEVAVYVKYISGEIQEETTVLSSTYMPKSGMYVFTILGNDMRIQIRTEAFTISKLLDGAGLLHPLNEEIAELLYGERIL